MVVVLEAPKRELTDAEKLFIDEYLVVLDVTKAAESAFKDNIHAAQRGYQTIRRPIVRAEIDRRQSELRNRKGIEAEQVIDAIADMAFYDVGEIAAYEINSPADIVNLPREIRAAVVGWSWDKNNNFTIKLADRSKALDQLARHLALYNDTVNVKVSEGLAERVRRAKERGISIPELKPHEVTLQ